jgi:hypothetical protein
LRANHQEDVAVIARRRWLPVMLVGLWMTHAPVSLSYGQELPPYQTPYVVGGVPQREPGRLNMETGQVVASPGVSFNQRVADTIVFHLRQSRQLHHFRVDISFQDGVAELTGYVADQSQREEVLRIVHGVPGVERVRDLLETRNVEMVRPAQAVAPPPVEPGPLPKQVPPLNGTAPLEPTPIFQAPPGAPGMQPTLPPPRLPPNAWPTYAPYNNYSRVAYPTLYPYQAWPFIGPNYPFPKIPLGWRSISLTWQDGHWWYGKCASGHDWWRIRYY